MVWAMITPEKLAELREMLSCLQYVALIAEKANLAHGAKCGATWVDPKPCSCGLKELDEALSALDKKYPKS